MFELRLLSPEARIEDISDALDALDALLVVAKQGLQRLEADKQVGGAFQPVVPADFEVAQVAVEPQPRDDELALRE